jgi:mannose-6-phosphate isomerase
MLYPLKFKPRFQEKIWGGTRLKSALGLDFSPLSNCGEAWALSGVTGHQTRVTNGFLAGNDLNEVLEVYMDELIGEKPYEKFGNEFPILVKFIDATDWLSIQVHPDDELAAKRGLGNGKTEMWYVIEAGAGAELISGFNRPADQALYLQYLEERRLPEILNIENVSAGDVFFMPAGRVHALGPGVMLAEIQQTSDTTYRIYDWDRVDKDGKARDLHIDEALEAIDFTFHEHYRTPYEARRNEPVELVTCHAFSTHLLDLDRPWEADLGDLDSCVVCVCIAGGGVVITPEGETLIAPGETVLLPAITETALFRPEPHLKMLYVYIPM